VRINKLTKVLTKNTSSNFSQHSGVPDKKKLHKVSHVINFEPFVLGLQCLRLSGHFAETARLCDVLHKLCAIFSGTPCKRMI